jgi:hypothetical protein
MAIYLDANALPADSQATALGFSVLRAVAAAAGQTLAIPALALDEALARRGRTLVDTTRELAQAITRLKSMGLAIEQPSLHGIEDIVDQWHSDVVTSCDVIATPDGAQAEGLRREIYRLPPTREGYGARDAVIWLTILADLSKRQEPCFFLSANTKDFANPQDKARLHPALVSELPAGHTSMGYFPSSVSLLASLANKLQIDGPTQLAIGARVAEDAVLSHITRAAFLERLILERAPIAPFIASAVAASLLEVRAQEGYSVGALELLVGWSRWELRFQLGVMHGFGRYGFAQDVRTVTLRCDCQLWLRRSKGDAAWRDAEVTAIDNLDIQWVD